MIAVRVNSQHCSQQEIKSSTPCLCGFSQAKIVYLRQIETMNCTGSRQHLQAKWRLICLNPQVRMPYQYNCKYMDTQILKCSSLTFESNRRWQNNLTSKVCLVAVDLLTTCHMAGRQGNADFQSSILHFEVSSCSEVLSRNTNNK